MQPFGPPENAANTIGNGLISTSCIVGKKKFE